MPRSSLILLRLDRTSSVPLYQQVQAQIREQIILGRLLPGRALPSARLLASDCEISRITAEAAYNGLAVEGYINRRTGSGTYVSEKIPDVALRVGDRARETRPGGLLSRRGQDMTKGDIDFTQSLMRAPFQSGLTDIESLRMLWRRLMGKQLSRIGRSISGYADPAGLHDLRKAIAFHVTTHRGVQCSFEQVVVTCGAQQGIDLCARLLLDENDEAWVEDPCYAPAVAILKSARASIVPVPVDEEGLAVSIGRARAEGAKLAYITPSHQYPLGVAMSMRRRLELLEWATTNDSWIIEDDYDSEFRYSGQPIEALQGLDRDHRVIYLGTFSKSLFPALRIGYLVLPPSLVDAFTSAKYLADRQGAIIEQAALAELISEGHFAAHLRRMRKTYAARQAVLLTIAKNHWADFLEIQPSSGGLFMLGRLREGLSDVDLSRRAFEKGVRVKPLSPLYLYEPPQQGFLLGFAAHGQSEMEATAKVLRTVVGSSPCTTVAAV